MQYYHGYTCKAQPNVRERVLVMAKRFTDTLKWQQPWFTSLGLEQKVTFFFLCDWCDRCGVWEINQPVFQLYTGIDKPVADLLEDMPNVVMLTPTKVFLTKFVPFQYGNLSRDCKAHNDVFGCLEKHSIDPLNLDKVKGYPKGSYTLKEKEKEIDLDKETSRDTLVKHLAKSATKLWNEMIAPIQETKKVLRTPSDARAKKFSRFIPKHATDLDLNIAIADIRKLLEIVAKSPHLLGNNNRKWQADLMWCVVPDNFNKIHELKYYDANAKASKPLTDKDHESGW